MTTITKTGHNWFIDGVKPNLGRTYGEGQLFGYRWVMSLFDSHTASLADDYVQRAGTAWSNTSPGNWQRPRDPNRNVNELIAQLPTYRAAGIRAFTCGLQGGSVMDDGSGMAGQFIRDDGVSAWLADGTIRAEWKARMFQLLDAADANGMVVNLQCLYRPALDVFTNNAAILTALHSLIDFVRGGTGSNNGKVYRNVIMELCNELNATGVPTPLLQGSNLTGTINDLKQYVIDSGYETLFFSTSTGTGYQHSNAGTWGTAFDYFAIQCGRGDSTSQCRGKAANSLAAGSARPVIIVENADTNAAPAWDKTKGVIENEGVGSFLYYQGDNYPTVGGDYRSGYQSPPVNWNPAANTMKSSYLDLITTYAGPQGGLSITFVNPSSGLRGATGIIITGTDFVNAASTVVKFNGVTAARTVNSSTQITATVPNTAPFGPGRITVETTTEGPVQSPSNFTVLAPPPTISSVAPNSGLIGATGIVITGTNFIDAASTVVKFNGVTATARTVNSSTQITATVPTTTTGRVTVQTAYGGPVQSPSDFTVLRITGVSPSSGIIGATDIIITGSGFVNVLSTGVKFNGVTATEFTVDSSIQITATVPAGATTGRVTVQTTTLGPVQSPADFTVLAITNVQLPSGTWGTSGIIITGSGFVNVLSTGVKFNGVTATAFTVDSSIQITATVPTGATTGRITVQTTTLGPVQSPADFTVLAISDVQPPSGLIGANDIIITGTGFVNVLSTGVGFNGVTATEFTVDSSIQITATVPLTATTGRITVQTTSVGPVQSPQIFNVLLTPPPTIADVFPLSGTWGTEGITITGTNFVDVLSDGVKFFNGVTATSFVVNSPTEIVATVPTGATTGRVTVETDTGGPVQSPQDFTVIPPPLPPQLLALPWISVDDAIESTLAITGISPSFGVVGTPNIIITGTGFVNVLPTTGVKFNGVTATSFVVDSPIQITATVPTGATTGRVTVQTTTLGPVQSPVDFTVLAITNVDPPSGALGDQVKITGSGFVNVIPTTGVKFNGVAATAFTVDSPTQITATVPNTTTGRVTVQTTTLGPVQSPSDFTFIGLTITNVSPGSGVVGTPNIIITGTGFVNAASTVVKFNGVTATRTVDSSTQITATVPTTTTGRITVQTATAGPVQSPQDFTVLRIINVDPSSGGVGTPNIIITGSGFVNAASTVVKFNGVTATRTVDSPTQITATVPNTATTGRVTVQTATLGPVQSPQDFTVTVLAISNVQPPSGVIGATGIIITGTNFVNAASTVVKFNGVTATARTVNSSTQITATVPNTATTGRVTVQTATEGPVQSPENFTVTTASGYGPRPRSSFVEPTGTVVTPANLASLSASMATGTQFILTAGSYTMDGFKPRSGQKFWGRAGAVFDGGTTNLNGINAKVGAQSTYPVNVELRFIEVKNIVTGLDGQGRWQAGGNGISPWIGWKIMDCTVHDIAGTGIGVGLEANDADGGVIAYNEVYRCGWARTSGFDGGGMKFARTGPGNYNVEKKCDWMNDRPQDTGFWVHHNHTHHNGGNGLWWDVSAGGERIEDNWTHHNQRKGIFFEISPGAFYCARNLSQYNSWEGRQNKDYGIGISGGKNTTIEYNTVGYNGWKAWRTWDGIADSHFYIDPSTFYQGQPTNECVVLWDVPDRPPADITNLTAGKAPTNAWFDAGQGRSARVAALGFATWDAAHAWIATNRTPWVYTKQGIVALNDDRVGAGSTYACTHGDTERNNIIRNNTLNGDVVDCRSGGGATCSNNS